MGPFGALIEGAFGLWNQKVNSDEAEFARDHSAGQAQLSRDWQERMSGSSYQRAVTDMKNAGLNPMLAYSQGGASTPSGAMGQSPQAHQHKPITTIGPATAAQIRNLDAQTEKTKAETDEIGPTARTGRELTAHHSANIRQQIGESAMRIEKIIEETTHTQASASQIRQQTQNLEATLPHIAESIRLLKAQTTQTGQQTTELKQRIIQNLPALEAAYKKLEIIYKEMEMPGRETDHAFQSSATGAILRTLKETLRDIIPGFGVVLPSARPKPSKGSTTTSSTHDSRGNSTTTYSRRTND